MGVFLLLFLLVSPVSADYDYSSSWSSDYDVGLVDDIGLDMYYTDYGSDEQCYLWLQRNGDQYQGYDWETDSHVIIYDNSGVN